MTKGVQASKTKQVVTLRLPAGRYKLSAARSIRNGKVYKAKLTSTRVRARVGQVTRVSVRWKAAPSLAEMMVSGSTNHSVSLRWRSAKGSISLVRKSGDVPPSNPKDGVELVQGSSTSLSDGGLASGSQFSYSLFVKAGRKWAGPVSTTVATPGTDPDSGDATPTYGLATSTVLVDPGDTDRVTLRPDGVWVTLSSSRSAPLIGVGIVLPVSDALPGGYLGRIDKIEPDGRTVHLAPGTMPDAFDSYSLDIDLRPAPNGFTSQQGEVQPPVQGPGDLPQRKVVSRAASSTRSPTSMPTCAPGEGASISSW